MGSKDFSDKEYERELQDTIKDLARDNDAQDELHVETRRDRFQNNAFDRVVDDAKVLYDIYLDSDECRDYTYEKVFQGACEAAVRYHAALIADDDDDIYDSLTTSQRSGITQYLKLGKAIKAYGEEGRGSRRSRGRDNDRDDRGGRGGRSNTRSSGRGRDRDDRDYERGSRDSRDSRRNSSRDRTRIHGGNVGRSNSVSNHLNNIEAANQSVEHNNTGNETVREARAPKVEQPQSAVGDVRYLPLLDIYQHPFDAAGKKAWPTIFHADTQLPLYLATDNGTNVPDIVEDVVLELTSPEAIKLKNLPIPDHSTHLLFRRRNPSGYQGDPSNMHDFENRLKATKDESLQQVYALLEQEGDVFKAKEGAKLPTAFSRKMVVVPDAIDASGFKDKVWAMISFIDQRVRAIDSSVTCEDYLAMATIEIDADSIIAFDDEAQLEHFEEIIQCMRMAKNYRGLAECMVDLANILPRRIWNVINDDLTSYILEVLEVEFALENPSIDSFTASINMLVDALEGEFGRAVGELFSDTVTKLIANCMQFTREPGTLNYRHYRMETVVMLPLVAEDVDYALALGSGIGMVSKELMPGLHAGLTRVLKYATKNKSRRINLITQDGASVSVHSSPLSDGCILLSNRTWV